MPETFRLRLEGGEEFFRDLRGLTAELRREVSRAAEASARRIATAARAAAPARRTHLRRVPPSGALRGSIRARLARSDSGRDIIRARVQAGGRGAAHAWLVERGARAGRMPRRPFFWPAYDAEARRFLGAVDAIVSRASLGGAR